MEEEITPEDLLKQIEENERVIQDEEVQYVGTS